MVGELAMKKPTAGQTVSGILVKRNFAYHIMSPNDIESKSAVITNAVCR